MAKKRLPKIGLALGCGGAKGLAHIGVLKVLEKNKIPISYIAGSSIGSLIGAFFAAYGSIKPLEELILKMDWKKAVSLLNPVFPKRGLLNSKKIEKFIERSLGPITFKDLKIPFTAVATDFRTNQEILINRGKVSAAIRSSISMPLVFEPVKQGKYILTDGGLSDPIPVKIVKEMGADVVIAVNLDAINFKNGRAAKIIFSKKLNLYHIAVFSLQILRYHLAKHCLEEADIIIEPRIKDSEFIFIGWDKFIGRERQELIRAGETAAKKMIKRIKSIM